MLDRLFRARFEIVRGGERPVTILDSRRVRPRTALLILAAVWIATMILTPLVGSQSISLGEILHGDPTAASIFWQIRLPRILLALLGGAALATSGLGFQTLFRNPLAEPYTLGVSSGAALGAVIALRFEGGSSWACRWWASRASPERSARPR